MVTVCPTRQTTGGSVGTVVGSGMVMGAAVISGFAAIIIGFWVSAWGTGTAASLGGSFPD